MVFQKGRGGIGYFWTTAIVLLLLNFILLTYTVHFSHVERRSTSIKIDDSTKPLQHRVTKKVKLTIQSRDRQHSGYQFAKRVQDNCKHTGSDFEVIKDFWITRMHVIPKHSAIYCPIEKVGTTFWRRFIYQLNHTKEKSHPYAVSIFEALTQPHERLENTTKPIHVRDHFKFTFVRDPYNRVLSAYIDKVFAPNPLFWKRFGEPSITMFRGVYGTRRRKMCYNDPTFTEFLQFVTWAKQTRKYMDPHILLASEMCIICSMNYTFIGKMENFRSDSTAIFQHFGLDESIHNSNVSLSKEAARDAIEDSIASPFAWRKAITRCIGWFEALLRIWRKLQMRGLIEMKYKLPVQRSQVGKVSREQFIQLAIEANKASNTSILKEQKRQVLLEMYRIVPERILTEFRNAYKMDFRLFDYDDRPPYYLIWDKPFVRQNFTDFRN